MLAKGVSKYHKTTLLQQYSNVKFCPLSKNGTGEFYGKYFFWEFDAKPTELSKTYKVLIIFHIDNYSSVVGSSSNITTLFEKHKNAIA